MKRKKYIDFYETKDVCQYNDLAAYLQLNGISLQKINEVRSFGESKFTSHHGPAILRISENDLKITNRLLEDWKKKPFESEGKVGEEFIMHEKSELDLTCLGDDRNMLIGDKLEKVFYVIANNIEYDYEHLHSVDFAIVLVFENGKTLSWVFGEFMDEENFKDRLLFYTAGYRLKLNDVRNQIPESFSVIEMTKNEYWKPLVDDPVIDIQVYTQEFGNEKLITDLILKTNSKIVGIFSTKAPSLQEEEIEFDLSISNAWTTVVFDRAIIELSERIKN